MCPGAWLRADATACPVSLDESTFRTDSVVARTDCTWPDCSLAIDSGLLMHLNGSKILKQREKETGITEV